MRLIAICYGNSDIFKVINVLTCFITYIMTLLMFWFRAVIIRCAPLQTHAMFLIRSRSDSRDLIPNGDQLEVQASY